MIIPENVNIYTLYAGTQFYRLCYKEYDEAGNRLYDASTFNPFNGADFSNPIRPKDKNGDPITSRFSPIEMQSGVAAPVLYGAETRRAAYFEYLFRPRQSNIQFITEAQLQNVEIATLVTQKSLRLADLRAIYFTGSAYLKRAFDYAHEAVFDDELYDAVEHSRPLVKEIYEAFPDIDGIAWDSVRLPNVMNIMLFRQQTPISILQTRPILQEKANWLPDLFQLLRRGEVNLTMGAKQLVQPSL